jgi:D-arabinose 1-dehydrogenase-like Zn-dependent alcohol dehydrogenase
MEGKTLSLLTAKRRIGTERGAISADRIRPSRRRYAAPMRAIVVHRLGPPEVLELADVPRPEPGPGQVLVHLHAIGVNFSDTERRRGAYKNLTLPWTPGTEGAGQVVAVGPGTDPGLAGGASPSGPCLRR